MNKADAPIGAFGLFLSNRTIGADLALAGRQLFLSASGRIYDPNTASFFSPDPFVAFATST